MKTRVWLLFLVLDLMANCTFCSRAMPAVTLSLTEFSETLECLSGCNFSP
jgi:hypothetical protein